MTGDRERKSKREGENEREEVDGNKAPKSKTGHVHKSSTATSNRCDVYTLTNDVNLNG